MRDEKRIESAIRMVERAERSMQKAGFDLGTIVTETDVENLTLENRFHLFNLFMRKLELAGALVAENEFIPDPERPHSDGCLKTDGAVLVVYENEIPLWHMEKHDNEWVMYRLDVSVSNMDDYDYSNYDWEDPFKNDSPKRHMPKRRIETVRQFIRNLEQADSELEEVSCYFPNPFNLENSCQFKTNGSIMVAYQQNIPVWYMRKENGEWQEYKMRIFLYSTDDTIDNFHDETEYGSDELENSIRDILEEIEDELDDSDEI